MSEWTIEGDETMLWDVIFSEPNEVEADAFGPTGPTAYLTDDVGGAES